MSKSVAQDIENQGIVCFRSSPVERVYWLKELFKPHPKYVILNINEALLIMWMKIKTMK